MDSSHIINILRKPTCVAFQQYYSGVGTLDFRGGEEVIIREGVFNGNITVVGCAGTATFK